MLNRLTPIELADYITKESLLRVYWLTLLHPAIRMGSEAIVISCVKVALSRVVASSGEVDYIWVVAQTEL